MWFDDADVAAVANKGCGAVDVGIVAYKYAVFKRCGYWVAEVAAENDLGLELKWKRVEVHFIVMEEKKRWAKVPEIFPLYYFDCCWP